MAPDAFLMHSLIWSHIIGKAFCHLGYFLARFEIHLCADSRFSSTGFDWLIFNRMSDGPQLLTFGLSLFAHATNTARLEIMLKGTIPLVKMIANQVTMKR